MKAKVIVTELQYPHDGRRKVTMVSNDKGLCELCASMYKVDNEQIELDIDYDKYADIGYVKLKDRTQSNDINYEKYTFYLHTFYLLITSIIAYLCILIYVLIK